VRKVLPSRGIGVALIMEQIVLKVPPGKIFIKDGRCPNNCSLMNKDKLLSGKPVVTTLVRLKGDTGTMHFNAFYGIFEYETDLDPQQGDVVDLYCPHCGTALSVPEKCTMCHVHMFAIHLPDGGEIRACPKVGCRNHQLTIVDLDAQFAEFYNEERRPKM